VVSLSFSPPNRLLQIGQNSVFGELNNRIAKIVSNLGRERGILFQMYSKTINKRAAPVKKAARKPGAKEFQYVVNIIIYGPEELCDPVGDYLTNCGICLQTPLLCDRDIPYQNPQMLFRPEEVVMTSTLLCNDLPAEVEKINVSAGLFSELSGGSDDHLALTDAPDAILTPLYTYGSLFHKKIENRTNSSRHQKKGLTFMVKRESGWRYDGSQEGLWVKEMDDSGQMMWVTLETQMHILTHFRYTNTITEMSQIHEPPDSKGGLLADQMGLGKSLTMISLIALNRCNITGLIHTENGPLRRLKSTLIVVLYSRWLILLRLYDNADANAVLETWNTQLKR
jgi:SWI/SNF-related matrix-associated actin-dependent regulator of chromatin subfamily A3